MRMRSAIPASVSGTRSASAATPAENARSKPRVNGSLEDLVATAGDRLQYVFRRLLNGRRKRRVAEVLREGLAFVSAVPREAERGESLRPVGEVFGQQKEREGGDGPRVRTGRVRDRQLRLLALRVAEVG